MRHVLQDKSGNQPVQGIVGVEWLVLQRLILRRSQRRFLRCRCLRSTRLRIDLTVHDTARQDQQTAADQSTRQSTATDVQRNRLGGNSETVIGIYIYDTYRPLQAAYRVIIYAQKHWGQAENAGVEKRYRPANP